MGVVSGDDRQAEEGPSWMGAWAHSGDRRTDFFYSDQEEPHATRKREILEKHPEIKELMGFEPLTKYMVMGTVALQLFTGWAVQDLSWGWFVLVAYIVGATANHSLFLAIHELAHNSGARTVVGNKAIAMLANCPIGIPYCITFKPFHMDHHRNQGVVGMDTDVPHELEAWVVSLSGVIGGYVGHTLMKACWVFLQIFFYALRPCLTKPDAIVIDRWLVLNYIVQISFDLLVVGALGWNALFYLVLSTFLAGSIHPTAGHFIAEHYVMDGEAETYSYYGPLNRLAYNVGFHNEHHDFPNIPWSRLPKVRAIAPEFYDDLPQCKSWPGTILRYIFDDRLSPYSRMKRQPKKSGKKD